MPSQKPLFFILLLSVLSLTFLSTTSAFAQDAEDLKLCQGLVRQRENQINLAPVAEEALSDLLHCNVELAELFNPTIVLEEGINLADFQCGFFQLGCGFYNGLALDYFNFWAGEDSYIKQIKEKLKPDEIERLALYSQQFPDVITSDTEKSGVDGIIASAYQKFAQDNSWSLDGFDGIKAVVSDFTFHYIRSELLGFGFSAQIPSDVQVMNSEAKRYQNDVTQCFSKAEYIQGVDVCIDLMKTYGSFGIGHYVLEKTLQKNFLGQIDPDKRNAFIQETDRHLNSCLPQYFFNPEEEGVAFQKMRTCVYFSLLRAFRWVVVDTLAGALRKDSQSIEVQSQVKTSLGQCEIKDWLDPSQNPLMIYRELLDIKAEEFEPKLLDCQNEVQDLLVENVIQSSIAGEAMIVEFYGDRLNDFTNKIVNVHYPRCLQLLRDQGGTASAQACENYLFVQTVFVFFDDLIAHEIESQLVKLWGEGDYSDQVRPILEAAQLAFSQCRLDLAENTLIQLEKKRPAWESAVTQCLNRAMVVVSRELVKIMIPHELANNAFLEKYSVSLGRNQIGEFAKSFGQCMGEGLADLTRLVDYAQALQVWQGDCELKVYRDVLVVVMDQILESELLGAGLDVQEFSQLLQDYKANPEGLYALVQKVQSRAELDQLTAEADRIVLRDLAPQLIDRMIEKEAGEYLGPKTQSRIVNLVTEHFLKCAQTKTIASCQNDTMPLAIEAILYNVLPAEVENEFEKASIHFLTPTVIKKLNVRQVVRDSFETPTGRMLIQYIVEQVMQGRGIGEITNSTSHPNTFRQLLFQVFANNRSFMANMLEAIVQPQINADRHRREKQSPFHWMAVNLLVHQEIFVWRNIKDMPSGREVQRRFVDIFERLITRPEAPIRRAEMQAMAKLVGDAAFELNRQLNRQNRNQNNSNSDR